MYIYKGQIYRYAYGPICNDNPVKPLKLTPRQWRMLLLFCPVYKRDGSVWISMN